LVSLSLFSTYPLIRGFNPLPPHHTNLTPGPNATTFITPAEIFPTRVRSTGHGLSAGLGKLGAVIAQVFFAPMIKRGATHDNPTPWIHGVMQIFALFMFLGMLTSLLVPESKNMSLEALSGEEERGPYELQFRTGYWRGSASGGSGRASGGSGGAVDGLDGVGGEGIRERGMKKAVLRGSSGSTDLEKGKWWKLG
jgi:PHS family inorganic phosphate transporter-like MFS transporter